MAQFKLAQEKTSAIEGKYANVPGDRGGETYRGVARKRWPSWPGWVVIDQLKPADGFPRNLELHVGLQGMVEQFYREHFWDPLAGDSIVVQEVADELYDTGVNQGVEVAAVYLQQALNALALPRDTDPPLCDDLIEDGDVSTKTLTALNTIVSRNETHLLLKMLNVYQGARYAAILKQDKRQRKFVRGWFKRVTL